MTEPEPGRRYGDPTVGVIERVHRCFGGLVALSDVRAVVAKCRLDLDVPGPDALPELLERLARQRLVDRLHDAVS